MAASIQIEPVDTSAEEKAADDAALAAAEKAGIGVDADNEVPAKFKNEDGTINTEALLKSYKELEKSRGQANDTADTEDDTGEAEDDEDETGAAEELEAGNEDASNLLANFGLDLNELGEEWLANEGKLTDESYATLAEKGFERELVDQFAAGQAALAERAQAEYVSLVGGQSTMDAMLQWAATSLPKDEIETFNKAMDGKPAEVRAALKGLAAQYKAAVPGKKPKPNLKTGKTTAAPADTFKSWQQVTKAMNDPRYGKDPAYDAELDAKLAASKL